MTGPNDFFQARQRSLQIRLRVRRRIHFLCVSTVRHAQYEEIKRDYGGSEDNLEVAVVERGTTSQRRLLQRLDVFKASGTEANLLWNQQWRLHILQNSAVTLTHTSKWSMSRSWKQRYLVCADSKFWIRSPEVTQEPWVKFNTSRRGLADGIRVRVGNKKRIRTDCLY